MSEQTEALAAVRTVYSEYVVNINQYYSSQSVRDMFSRWFKGCGRYGDSPLHEQFLDDVKTAVGRIAQNAKLSRETDEEEFAAWQEVCAAAAEFMLFEQKIDQDRPEGFTLIAAEILSEPLFRYIEKNRMKDISERYRILIKKKKRFPAHEQMYKNMLQSC